MDVGVKVFDGVKVAVDDGVRVMVGIGVIVSLGSTATVGTGGRGAGVQAASSAMSTTIHPVSKHDLFTCPPYERSQRWMSSP